MNEIDRILRLQCRAYMCAARAQVEDAIAAFWAARMPNAPDVAACRSRAAEEREDAAAYMARARALAERAGVPVLAGAPVWFPEQEDDDARLRGQRGAPDRKPDGAARGVSGDGRDD